MNRRTAERSYSKTFHSVPVIFRERGNGHYEGDFRRAGKGKSNQEKVFQAIHALPQNNSAPKVLYGASQER